PTRRSSDLDDRRTSIGYDEYDISMEDLIPKENTVLAMTKLGYIKRMTVDNFRSQNRGGKGIKGMSTIEDDYIEELLMTTTHHYLDRKSTRLNSSHVSISYAVFCLKKKNNN